MLGALGVWMVRVPPGFCSSPHSQFGQLINQLFIEVLGPEDTYASKLFMDPDIRTPSV